MAILIHCGQNKALRNYDTYTHFKILYVTSYNGHDIKESQDLPFSSYGVFFLKFCAIWPAKCGKQLRITTKASDKQTAAWSQFQG